MYTMEVKWAVKSVSLRPLDHGELSESNLGSDSLLHFLLQDHISN
jgi:hypothetical protein